MSAVSTDLELNKLPDIIEMDKVYIRVKKGFVGSRYGLAIHGNCCICCLTRFNKKASNIVNAKIETMLVKYGMKKYIHIVILFIKV